MFEPDSPADLLDLDETDAMASFAIFQWIQLDWEVPDAIIPMPDSSPIALSFARILDRPFVKALSYYCEYKEGRLEEDQTLLLFDLSNNLPTLQKASLALGASFPKRIYLLSLFPCF